MMALEDSDSDSDSDSISCLPDEVLGKILSLVPTKVAASTSVLSKRWRNLLPLVDTLCFDNSLVFYPNKKQESACCSHGFLDFVDKTFALLRNSPIKKFSLRRELSRKELCYCTHQHSRVTRWFVTAMQRGFPEVHLCTSDPYSKIELQTKSLRSNTLVKLSISGPYDLQVDRMFFPALKSLSLLSVLFDCDNYDRLLLACPVLEELFIRDTGPSPNLLCTAFVESASLKRLVVFCNLTGFVHEYDSDFIIAPSLVYLDYSSYVSQDYPCLDLGSLVEARLSLWLWESTEKYDYDQDDGDDHNDDDDDDDDFDFFYNSVVKPESAISGDVTKLVAGITNITTLHLSPDSLEAFHFCCKSMPVFNNLLNLSIESSKEKGWQVMPLLLKSCPDLQNLVIKGLVHRVTNKCGDACACIPKNPSQEKKKRKIVKEEEEEKEKACCLFTCPVKVLEILEYAGSSQELEQMRHFLGKLKSLDTVKVGVDISFDNNNKSLQASLLTLPRLSSKCNIQFT